MTAATLTLADFLLARIAEDEAVARVKMHDPYEWQDEPAPHLVEDRDAMGLAGPVDGPSGYEVLMIDPARVLAECEAKRRIVTLASAYSDGPEEPRTLNLANDVLTIMATTWANHPDYDEAWRP